jgi:hypothetical protein
MSKKHAILLMASLLVSVIVLFVCPDQISAWIFLVLVVLAQMPKDGHRKTLAKIKRIRKAIDK